MAELNLQPEIQNVSQPYDLDSPLFFWISALSQYACLNLLIFLNLSFNLPLPLPFSLSPHFTIQNNSALSFTLSSIPTSVGSHLSQKKKYKNISKHNLPYYQFENHFLYEKICNYTCGIFINLQTMPMISLLFFQGSSRTT